MNKKLLAVALGVAFAAPAFADSSSLTIGGRLHTAIVVESPDNAGSTYTMDNMSSRLNFKVQEDLGGGLKAIGGIEYGLASDDGEDGGGVGQLRNIFVGFDMGSAGRFVMGRLDGGAGSAPLYDQVFKGIKAINHDTGRASGFAGNNTVAGSTIAANHRVSNALGYGVKIAGVQVDSRLSLNAGGTAENDSRELQIAATGKLANVDLGVGIARNDYSDNVEPATFAQYEDRVQFVAGTNIGSFRVGGLIAQNSTFVNDASGEDSFMEYGLSGALKVTSNGTLIANYMMREVTDNSDRTQWQVGYTYDFSKRTMVYGMIQNLEVDADAANGVGALDTDGLTIGVRHNF